MAAMAGKRILVTGASGLLGRPVLKRLGEVLPEAVCLGTCRTRTRSGLVAADLADPAALARLLDECRPDVIVNTAAERRPDVCERAPDAVDLLNVALPRGLAAWTAAQGARLIQISTDYVFDGSRPPYRPDDPPCPINAYGRSKLAAEEAVRQTDPRAVILRVPILYGQVETLGESAVTAIAAALLAGKGRPVEVENLCVRYPTLTDDVAEAVARIVAAPASVAGILHVSGEEAMTKWDLARIMAPLLGIDPACCLSDERPSATPRPHDCHLATDTARALGLLPAMTPFRRAIGPILAAHRT